VILSLLGPLEALLFAAGSEGLSIVGLSEVLEIPASEVVELCAQLRLIYDERQAGIELVELAGAWQIVTKAAHASYLQRLSTAPSSPGVSQAALEVLAIISYRQPISRSEIESVRGVQSERVIHSLVHRQLIAEVGRMDSPGRPILYGTTPLFLQVFGLRSLDDLPPLPNVEAVPQDFNLFELSPTLPRD